MSLPSHTGKMNYELRLQCTCMLKSSFLLVGNVLFKGMDMESLKMSAYKLLLVVFSLCVLSDSSNIPNIKDEKSCVINDSPKTPGTCKPLTACPAVLGELRAGIQPTACSSSHGPGVVCCPTKMRISAEKCQEFTKILRKPLKAKEALVYDGIYNQTRSSDNSLKCESFLIGFITGGRNAREREYPYQVAIGHHDKFWCGGTLIDPLHVLTAGHCVITSYGPPKVVLLGDRKLSSRKDPSRTLRNVSEIYVHHQYKPPIQYNDIAIIKLESAVRISRGVLPACLPDPADRLDRLLTVEATGFGQTGAFEGQSDILQSVFLKKFDTQECTDFFTQDEANKERLPNGIRPSQFCAGDKLGFRDTCKGDSGGPVTVSKEDTPCVHYVVGITSFGPQFCGYQQPGVYTNVLSYLDWIENFIWYNASTQGRSKLYKKLGSSEKLVLAESTTTATTPIPEVTSPTAEATKSIPEVTSPTTEATKPIPDVTSPTTEASKPIPEVNSLITAASTPTPEVTTPTTGATKPIAMGTTHSTTKAPHITSPKLSKDDLGKKETTISTTTMAATDEETSTMKPAVTIVLKNFSTSSTTPINLFDDIFSSLPPIQIGNNTNYGADLFNFTSTIKDLLNDISTN